MTLVAVDLAFSCCACTPKLLERLMKFCACLVWKCLAAAIKECVSMHAQQAHLCPWILQWLQPRVEAWESGNEYTVLDWGGLLKSSVEESEVPDGEESSESRLLHSLQMRERERVQKERLRDVIQWKSCLSNPIFIFFPELGWNGALPVYCPVLFLTSNFISLMFFVWWPSCGTGFLLLRAEGRHCFWFLFFFCLHTVPFLVMPLGSIITVIEPTVQYAAVYSAQVLKCVPHSFQWIEGALLFGRLLTRSSRGIVNINTCSFCFLVALAERI